MSFLKSTKWKHNLPPNENNDSHQSNKMNYSIIPSNTRLKKHI